MDELNEKAVVKIDSDGGVVKCAKGLGGDECGYKAGAKVCGACGAMAVVGKGAMEPAEQTDEVYSDEMNDTLKKRKKREMEMREENLGAKEMMAEDEEEEDTEEMMVPEDEEETATPMRRRGPAVMDEEDDEMMDEEDDEMGTGRTWMMKPDKTSRSRAMNSMGMKSGEDEEGAYICQLERKVYPGSSDICENCPGGCQSEGGMPGLLDVEGLALGILGGKVLDSGYSFDADLFVVQVKAADGKTYEMLNDGQTGELLELKRIQNVESGIEGKSAFVDDYATGVISASDAVEIALKSLEAEFSVTGDVVAADADMFLGHDVYAVEIDAVNGKSYDVYVTLDGQFVGLDEWTAEEAEEIEAEAAEIALKRAYSEESRMDMAKRGMALPDGSYPIKDVADLRNAIQAFGRAKDKEAAKAHIMKRARALNAEDMIPENWMSKEKSDNSAATPDASESFLASLMEFEMIAQEEDLKDIL